MFRSILVPLDGSKFAEQAIVPAAQLTHDAGAKLYLAEVSHETVYGTEFGATAVIDDRPIEMVRSYLAGLSKRLNEQLGFTPATGALQGPTVESLMDYVDENEIDLIVMTTHGRGPIARLWLGSVADELTRAVSVPMLLLRSNDSERDAIPSGRFRHILVALDGTSEADNLIAPAVEIAKMSGAEITLARVLEIVPIIATDMPINGLPSASPEILSEIKSAAHDSLEQTVKLIADAGAMARAVVVEYPDIASGILQECKQNGCDLIVMATHGYGGFERLVMGSVTDQVVRHAETPVLVYHTITPAVPASKSAASRETNMDSTELTNVFTTGDPNLARMVANELESEGISAMVNGENQAGLSGILDVEVFVRAADADRAHKIIEESGHHDKPAHRPDRPQKVPEDHAAPHSPHGKKPHIG